MFTASHVWSLAAAAQRINGDYLKEDVYDFDVDQRNPVKTANKKLVKQWLREGVNPATELDTAAGEQCRDYFKTFLLRELSGKINDFERQALRIAQKDEFSNRDMLDFAIVACLPSVAARDKDRQELKREIYQSEQLVGSVGDTIVGDLEVIRSSYSQNYNKYKVYGRMGESFIDFWFTKPLEGSVRVKGKIKALRGDKTTALNYVKITG
jgi:hypothetical protein